MRACERARERTCAARVSGQVLMKTLEEALRDRWTDEVCAPQHPIIMILIIIV